MVSYTFCSLFHETGKRFHSNLTCVFTLRIYRPVFLTFILDLFLTEIWNLIGLNWVEWFSIIISWMSGCISLKSDMLLHLIGSQKQEAYGHAWPPFGRDMSSKECISPTTMAVWQGSHWSQRSKVTQVSQVTEVKGHRSKRSQRPRSLHVTGVTGHRMQRLQIR